MPAIQRPAGDEERPDPAAAAAAAAAGPDDRIGLFDMDGTLANYEQAMEWWLERLRSPGEPFHRVHAREPAYAYERQRVIRRQPGFWRDLEPIELGFEVLEVAREVGFTNFHACTKGPDDCPAAWSEKVEWIQRHKREGRLPAQMRITITEDKTTVYGRFLCDDHVPFLEGWLRYRRRGLGILVLPRPRDLSGLDLHPNILPFSGGNRAELRRRLALAFERAAGSPAAGPAGSAAGEGDR
jgi:hypothetical protein